MLLSRLILIHKNSILVLKNKCGILEYQKEGCCIIISNLLRTPVGGLGVLICPPAKDVYLHIPQRSRLITQFPTLKMSVFVALTCYGLRNYPDLIRTVYKLHGI